MPTPPNVLIQSSSSSFTLIPAPPGNFSFIKVLGYNITADAATVVTLQDDQGTVFDTSDIEPAGSGLVKVAQTNDCCFILGKGRSLVVTNTNSANLKGSLQFSTPMAGW